MNCSFYYLLLIISKAFKKLNEYVAGHELLFRDVIDDRYVVVFLPSKKSLYLTRELT